jgi:hypothetical protein
MSATKRNAPRRAATAMRRCNLKKHNRIRGLALASRVDAWRARRHAASITKRLIGLLW